MTWMTTRIWYMYQSSQEVKERNERHELFAAALTKTTKINLDPTSCQRLRVRKACRVDYDRVNWSTMLRHVESRPVINTCMIKNGAFFTYFSYHLNDENLASIFYYCYEAKKAWYIIPPLHLDAFERGLQVIYFLQTIWNTMKAVLHK